MKLDAKSKVTIKKILEGKIYDIYSFVIENNMYELIQYDKMRVEKLFDDFNIQKKYYWNIYRERNKTNILTEEEFNYKKASNKITPTNFRCDELELSYTYEKQRVKWGDDYYVYDFYKGVYVMKDAFPEIQDFLTLCQYLKSEMFLFETSNNSSQDTLALFFEKTPCTNQGIDFNNLTYCDEMLLKDEKGYCYHFSEEKSTFCKDYIGKRFYPTIRLRIFAENGFRTIEEKNARATLITSWIAIAVAILVALIPQIMNQNNKYLENIVRIVTEIKDKNIWEEGILFLENKYEGLENDLNNVSSEISEIKEIIQELVNGSVDNNVDIKELVSGKKR